MFLYRVNSLHNINTRDWAFHLWIDTISWEGERKVIPNLDPCFDHTIDLSEFAQRQLTPRLCWFNPHVNNSQDVNHKLYDGLISISEFFWDNSNSSVEEKKHTLVYQGQDGNLQTIDSTHPAIGPRCSD